MVNRTWARIQGTQSWDNPPKATDTMWLENERIQNRKTVCFSGDHNCNSGPIEAVSLQLIIIKNLIVPSRQI